MKRQMKVILYAAVAALFLSLSDAKTLYMDSMATCGQTFTIYDMDFAVLAHMDVQNQAVLECKVIINTGYSDSNYLLEIEQKNINIQDCAFQLAIFNGQGTVGTPLKTWSCGSKSTGVLLSKQGTITLQLRRPDTLFEPMNTFALVIRSYRSPDAPANLEGISHLPVGAIIGIVLGTVVMIAFTIFLCWCFCSGKIAGLGPNQFKKKMPYKDTRNGTFNSAYETQSTPKSFRKSNLKEDDILESLTNESRASTEHLENRLNSFRSKTREPRQVIQSSQESDMDLLAGHFVKNKMNGKVDDNVERTTGRRAPRSTAPATQTVVDEIAAKEKVKYDDEDPEHAYENFTPDVARIYSSRKRNARAQPTSEETDIKRPIGIEETDQDTEMSSTTVEKPQLAAQPTSGIVEELKRELSKRKSVKDKEKKETLIDDPGNYTQDSSYDRLPEEGKIDSKYKGMSQQSDPAAMEKMTNPLLTNSNPAIRASVNELRPRGSDESPRARKKKKRHNSGGKRSVSGDGPRRHKNAPGFDDEMDTDALGYTTEDLEPYPSKSTGVPLSSLPLPPEALAPVFSTDASGQLPAYPQGYQYEQQQPQLQPQPHLIGYDAYGNEVYSYDTGDNQPAGSVPSYPYGQGQGWYVQATPDGYVMVPTPGYAQADGGAPGFTSTPSDPNRHSGRKKSKKHKNNVLATTSGAPGGFTGTILDEMQFPPPGTTLVRSGVDPHTGANTNQVIWTDSARDPTDPPPGVHNPQVTRKSIVRVTTRDTDQGDLTDAPNPALNQLSFNTAQQLQAGVEPAFLSPTKSFSQPQQNQPISSNIVYSAQTPERANVGFYTGARTPAGSVLSAPGAPVVHNAPQKHHQIRDRVTMSTSSDDLL